jgi:hypothetical protein
MIHIFHGDEIYMAGRRTRDKNNLRMVLLLQTIIFALNYILHCISAIQLNDDILYQQLQQTPRLAASGAQRPL